MSSFLVPLEPLDAGTWKAESLASYFSRLACLHGVSLAQLGRVLLARRSIRLDQPYRMGYLPFYSRNGAGLWGFGERLADFVDLLVEATGITSLDRHTFVYLRGILAKQSTGATRITRAWCEACFEQQLETPDPVHDHLLWSLQQIGRCPTHQLALRSLCPACQIDQPFHHRSGTIEICWKCSSSLIGPTKHRALAPNGTFAEKDCISIVTMAADGRLSQVLPDPLFHFENTLKEIQSPILGRVHSISEPSGSAKAAKRVVRPSFQTLLRKAYAAGVSAASILEDPISAAKIAGELFYDERSVPPHIRARYPDDYKQSVREQMEKLLKKPRYVQIPSLKSLCKEFVVSEGFIRHSFPDIVKRYQSHRHSATISRTLRLRGEAKLEAQKAISDGLLNLLTQRELAEHISETTGASIRDARTAVCRAVSQRR